MPSPFPGMDPYLEERAVWPDVHTSLMTYIRESLQPQIRPKYVARIGERILPAGVSRSVIPDALLARRLREPWPTLTPTADEPLTISGLDDERRVPYIEIVYSATADVVTLIEILSPANKVGDGRDQYLQKQADILATGVNLVEIDLLGYGKETTAARNAIIMEPPDWRYIVSVSRSARRSELEVYAVSLSQRLPRPRIPLRPPDPDAVLDLPAVFTRCYDVGGYDLLVDYSQLPDTRLSDEEQAWLRAHLAKRQAADG